MHRVGSQEESKKSRNIPEVCLARKKLQSSSAKPQKSFSNVQAKSQSVGGAEHGAERKAEVVE